ncbi:coiled-coil domain-containing protein 22 homolog [Ricinus communis]|uniref:coiled-coil domain-containing protein 22 homolog n=1 Tax=Ricinus communis TaxID=3988 RepID=UPI000772BE09|nr:coiled-coil domain-containing protein 22 homolog [Ricinus communis]|eukprot:XP_015577023.1 coiled-coil domain-containing protein 22 homolog [Ricinus communis]
MEDHILLKSLQNAGVSVPGNVSSIRDMKPETLVSISAQCLNLLDQTTTFPSSFPDSLVDKFKICTDIALAVKRLGYIGDMTYYKFLYPSEEDLFKLVRFLVERLSELSNAVKIPDLKDMNAIRIIKKDGSTDNLKDYMEKANDKGLDCNHHQENLKDLGLQNVEPEFSDPNVDNASFTGSRTLSFGKDKLTGIAGGNLLIMEGGESVTDDFGSKEIAREDDKHQSSKIRDESEILQNQKKFLIEEVTARISEIQNLEEEFQLLKAASEMAFDDQHPIDFYLEQLNDQVDSRKLNIMELDSQWDAFRKPLEEKKISLEESLYANIPEAREKLQKLREVELERESILSEIRREDEHSKLSVDLKKQSGLPSRTSYIERIKEITKNSRKQDADIERILKETRELQLESNSIQDRLHRTYTVLDELVFREAKKEPVGRQAYRLLTSIHECFEQISEKILLTDRIQREMVEHEKKLTAMATRSLNIDKLQADLDAIRKENENLQQQLQFAEQ